MLSNFSNIQIYGGDKDSVEACTNPVKDGDQFNLVSTGDILKVTCYHTPCHTKGHILYYLDTEYKLEEK